MRRKNTKFIDPRYFMDEKMEEPKVLKEGQIGPDEYISKDPAWSSSNPPDYTPEEQLVLLKRRLETAFRNPGAAPGIQKEIDALLVAHPELKDA